ncbi:MAG TPA: peptidoglycan-binding protein [Pseudonocardiaceae bacterium]|nr:peptidoglycan-binding protein [Pseudonocardiaceae bacterium]
MSPRRERHRRRRGRWVLLVVVVLIGAAVVVDRTHPHGVDLAHPLGRNHDRRPAGGDNVAATATTTLTRRSLSAQTSVNGTLGYTGDYVIGGQSHGTITWLPAVGQVIRQGQVLYRVNGAPVILLYGSTPAYRELAEGADASDVTGTDVAQLNRDLVALGYGSDAELDPSSDEFGWATKAAVEDLQEALGVEQTGKLALGQVVFLPTSARITTVGATLGAPAGGQVVKASSTTRQVTVDLDAAQQSQVKVGDKVSLTLPNGRTTPGVVAAVGKVATVPAGNSGSSPTVEVDITPTDSAATGTLDQAPVQVEITTGSVHGALAVPVNALVALAGGGYAVEVVAADGVHRLVGVTLGLFDDAAGLVQVTGSGLAAGQHVVVPAS